MVWLFKDSNILDLKEKILQIYDRRYDLQKIKLNARSQAEQKANWNGTFRFIVFLQTSQKKSEGLRVRIVVVCHKYKL